VEIEEFRIGAMLRIEVGLQIVKQSLTSHGYPPLLYDICINDIIKIYPDE